MRVTYLHQMGGAALLSLLTIQTGVAQLHPIPIANGYSVIRRGPDDRVLEKIDHSSPLATTNSFVEVATGMHYWDGNDWRESQDLIELTSDGAAVVSADLSGFPHLP